MAVGVGVLVLLLKGCAFSTMVQAYDIHTQFQYQSAASESQRANSFAQDLCVVSGDQSLDSVSLESDQEGLLLDLNDKAVLYAKGAYDKVYPASITKIMTALLAFTNGNMDDVVTITEENITLEEGSQVVGFQVGIRLPWISWYTAFWYIPVTMLPLPLLHMLVDLQKILWL